MEKKRSFGVRLMLGYMRLRARLPLRYHYAWARAIAWFTGHVMHYRSDEVLTNLARSFPDMKYKEIKRLRDRFYLHFGEIFAELIWFGGHRGEKGCCRLRDSRLVTITNVEEFNALYDRSSSVMLLNSHAGNWELMGGIMRYTGGTAPHWSLDELVVLYRELHSHFWDQVIGANRCAPVEHLGFEGYIESRNILRYAVSHRREKRLYVFNTDQYPYGGTSRCEVGTFLNQPTWAMTGGASLACKLGMGVAYIRWTQVEQGRYELTFVPLLENAADSTPEEIMKKYYAHLEKDIQAQPWNYLWTHRRWK